MAFFCTETGVRIVAPGVSKSVDPVNGQDEEAAPPPHEFIGEMLVSGGVEETMPPAKPAEAKKTEPTKTKPAASAEAKKTE